MHLPPPFPKLFYHELPQRHTTTLDRSLLTLAPPSGYALDHRNGSSSTTTLYSNSLKTENSLTVLPRLLSVSKTKILSVHAWACLGLRF